MAQLTRTAFTAALGKQINDRRKAQGLRTMEIAVRLDTSQFTVGRHLRGDSMLTAEQIVEYSELLGCSPAELLPRKGRNGEWVARDPLAEEHARARRDSNSQPSDPSIASPLVELADVA